ncbi:MAG TPA: NlpC/P60 family protein [Bacteroidota bacterium]|nr:NlpC/P60 family protein [Bacteroidota bacterium]
MKKLYLIAVIVLFTGCGSSSPRFGASEAKNKSHHTKVVRNTVQSQEASEQAAEDDVKVDAKQVLRKARVSSSHSSKKKARRSATSASVQSAQNSSGLDASQEQSPDVRSVTDDASPASSAQDSLSGSMSIDQQKMMETIAQWLETPYQYGSDGEEAGIDCSAFTREVFEEVLNVTLPRSSAEQSQVGDRVSRDELKFGDLVFFKTRGRRISHVGIYIGDDLFAHASSGSGVTISSLDSTYFNKRYAAARRVLK